MSEKIPENIIQQMGRTLCHGIDTAATTPMQSVYLILENGLTKVLA
jgi:hypothetical protein